MGISYSYSELLSSVRTPLLSCKVILIVSALFSSIIVGPGLSYPSFIILVISSKVSRNLYSSIKVAEHTSLMLLLSISDVPSNRVT